MKNTFLALKGCFFISLVLLVTFLQSCGNSTPKTKEEPYTVIEKQDTTLTYLIKDNEMHYNRIVGAILLGQNPGMRVYATVTNTSDYAGVFKLNATLSSQGNTIEFEVEEYIAAGATKDLIQSKEINPYSFETNVKVDKWGITAPKRSINVPVTKYRTVVIK